MHDRHDGHPLGAALILVAIFSVAWAFHLATPQVPESIPARVTAPTAMQATGVAADPPAIPEQVSGPPAQRSEPRAPLVVSAPAPAAALVDVARSEPPIAPAPGVPTLAAFSWSTVQTPYPPTVWPSAGDATPVDRGAVTQAFANASHAVRSAFKKAF